MKRLSIFIILSFLSFYLWGQQDSLQIAILNSPQKENVKKAVQEINTLAPTATIFLGDLISGNENDFLQYVFYLNWLEMPLYAICGNKDFSVFKSDPQDAISALMMPSPYYSETFLGQDNSIWRFFFLDGNQLSLNAYKRGSIPYKYSKNQKNKLYKKASEDCGAMGEKQLRWLDLELNKSQQNNEKVLLFCRYPLTTQQGQTLWDHEALKTIIKKYSCVKCYFSDAISRGLQAIPTNDKKGTINAYGVLPHNLKETAAFTILTIQKDKLTITENATKEQVQISF